MPKINDIMLPTVTLDQPDCDAIAGKIAAEPLALEALIELSVYLKREKEKANELDIIDKVVRGRINAIYEKLPEAARETTRTKVGMVTYTGVGIKIELRDRDASVARMTEEQLRITYKPDIKAMETIMKADDFEEHIKRTPTKSRITIKDTSGLDYDELDF